MATLLQLKETGFVSDRAPLAGAISAGGVEPHCGAGAFTCVDAEAWLFAVFGSLVEALTVTLSTIRPAPGGAMALIVIGDEVPTATDCALQETPLPDPLQVQPDPVAVLKVTPAGKVSITVTLCAAFGPALETVTVYVIGSPVLTDAGAETLTERSAELAMATVAVPVDEQLPFVTVTLIVMEPPFPAVHVIDGVPWPPAMMPPLMVHAYVVPAGPAGTDAVLPFVFAPTDGGALMATLPDPAMETFFDALALQPELPVTVTPSITPPAFPALKVIELVPAPAVIVPPLMVHA